MSEFTRETPLTDSEITDLLIIAYKASDLRGEILTADIPVRSPASGGRYERMFSNAGARYEDAVAKLSESPDLQELSDAIHAARCGCTPAAQREGCDWQVAGRTSSARSQRILQAGELKINGLVIEDITDYPAVFNKWIDYLEAPRGERPRLQAELEQLVAETTG